MPMRSLEMSAKTVDEAVRLALDEMDVERDRVEVEVLEEGNKGLFGLLGTRQAKVRVTIKNTLEDKAERAIEFLEPFLRYMGVDEAAIEYRIAEDNIVHININGRRLGIVIGRRGKTLDAIQYLVNLAANKEKGPWARIVLDAEGYRERREETLQSLAERLADKVRRQRRKAVLEPMNALERRIIHLALADDESVETHSEGDEPYRRVVIVPKR